jgi:hypothetical protein
MRRESKLILGICVVIIVFLVAFYIGAQRESQPEINEQQAKQMLDRLAQAFHKENVNEVLSFASPDAIVAGKKLKEIHSYLSRGFTQTKDLQVRFEDVQYDRKGDTVELNARAVAEEGGGTSGAAPTQTYYNQPVKFVLHKRSVPQLGGVFYTSDWKITEVDARGLPEDVAP